MALQKRINYGFNGYEAPPIPRAARSARRHLFKKKANESQMCAFDLLATVAGKLLLDGENPPPNPPGKDQPMTVRNSVEKEENDEDKPLEDRDCYERNFLITEIVSKAPNPNHSPDKLACNQNDTISRPASGVTSSDGSEKIGSDEQLVNDECKLSLGISTPSVDIESSGFRFSAHSGSSGSDDDMRKDVKPDPAIIRNLSISHKASQFGSGHAEASDWKSSALVCSVDSVKFPFCRDGSFPVNGDNVKLVTKDDDENSSECIELRNKAFKPPEEHSFRKFLAPKITSNVKDDEDVTERCSYLNRRNGVKRQRPLQDYPFKKRKLYNCGMASNSDESIAGDGNGENDDGLGYVPSTPAAVAATPTSAGGYASSSSRNSQVKLRIKSFRVPELFIEIPESATVGSLKRMVMDSVNMVLGDGLHVGVLLQGKRIKDDSKTLLQSGISHDKRLDTLGFSLERSPTPATIRSYPEDCPNPVVCENPQPLARYASPLMITENGGQQGNQEIHINNFIESDHDSAPSPPGLPLQRATPVKQDALAIVPLRKSKRTESTQRRIRRPFTVAEVEALVQAVEKLGTGRWRDVKLRAFDNAKHRTYVDLKDKWKTLVHTAGISPQQRRGEPVPQELLDRVLTAHAYWSHHQPKHHLNSHPLSALFL